MVDYRSLVGKQWHYRKQDCYTLVRDYYSLLGITLSDFERPENLHLTDSIFLEKAESEGFKLVDFGNRQTNDVLIMRLMTRAPMHAAIYIGNDKILHQRMNGLSTIEPFRRYYWERTVAVFRHATSHASW